MSGLRPFFTFYGGKWRLAPRYPAPLHATIVEPFAGSAGYAMRHADRRVVLCDADPIIAGLWRYLTRVTSAEILALPDIAHDGSVDDAAGACEEARWLIGFWLNGGTSSPRKRPSKWVRDGWRPRSKWGPEVRERIASQLHAIRHWEIRDGFRAADLEVGTWFIDPPYVGPAGTHYRHGSKRIDYPALGEWCRGRRGQVIVCEADGAAWLPFAPFADAKATGGKRRTGRSAEAIWYRENTRPTQLALALSEAA